MTDHGQMKQGTGRQDKTHRADHLREPVAWVFSQIAERLRLEGYEITLPAQKTLQLVTESALGNPTGCPLPKEVARALGISERMVYRNLDHLCCAFSVSAPKEFMMLTLQTVHLVRAGLPKEEVARILWHWVMRGR